MSLPASRNLKGWQCWILASLAVLLAGCASAPSEEGIVTDVGQRPLRELEVQYDLGLDIKEDFHLYDIPDGPTQILPVSRGSFPRAREIISASKSRTLSIRRVRDTYWMSAEIAPSNLWPAIKNYIIGFRGGLNEESAESGVLITQEVEVEDAPARTFVYRLDAGLIPGSAEVEVIVLERDTDGELQRMKDKDATDIVSDELKSLLEYLTEASTSVGSLSVQHLDFRRRTRVEIDGTVPRVYMRLPLERAWVVLRNAIEDSDIILLDSDIDQLKFEVAFVYELLRELPALNRVDDDSWYSVPGTALPRLAPRRKSAVQVEDGEESDTRYVLELREDEQGEEVEIVLLPGHGPKERRALLSRIIQNLR